MTLPMIKLFLAIVVVIASICGAQASSRLDGTPRVASWMLGPLGLLVVFAGDVFLPGYWSFVTFGIGSGMVVVSFLRRDNRRRPAG